MDIELREQPRGSQAGDVRNTSDDAQDTHDSARNTSNAAHDASEITNSSPRDYPSGLRLALITIGLILTIFLSALDLTILATAIPKITTQFRSLDDVGWYSSGYAVSNAAFQTAWGKAYKHFPMKRVFIIAVLLFETGNLISGAAPNSATLIAGRVIAGCGGAGSTTAVFIFIAFTVRPEYKALYFSVLGVTYGCASVVGPLVGGAFADGPGWRWCFWINLPIGLVATTMVTCFFQQPLPPPALPLRDKLLHMDLNGSLTIMGASICFVLAMRAIGVQASFTAPLTAFLILLVLFVANEYWMGERAMIQGHLLRRQILPNLAYMLFIAGLYFSLLFALPIQFQAIDDTSASESGVRLIPFVLGISIFTMVANTLLTFWRHYQPLLVVGALLATCGAVLIGNLDADTSLRTWIGYEVITAMGIGLALQVPMIANQAAVPDSDIAAVTSMTLFTETFGTTLFVAAGQAAFTNRLVTSLARHAPSIDPLAVVNAGATQIRQTFPPSDVQGILASYLDGCKTSHVVSVASGAAALLVSLAVAVPSSRKEWRKWRHKPHVP